MRARLEKMTPEQWDMFDVPYEADNDGTAEVEVIGFATRGWDLMVVWRDDLGYIRELPSRFVRVLPHVSDEDLETVRQAIRAVESA